MKLSQTPTTYHQFEGFPFYLKRDEKLHPYFSGNKARKLMSLLTLEDSSIKCLVGYGSPQANSLLSLAALAQLKGWQFEFYVDRIPGWLKAQPIGNYRKALELGARIISVSDIASAGKEEAPKHPCQYAEERGLKAGCLLVPEGGRSKAAEQGVEGLAKEIRDWIERHQLENVCVALPSGTGTTALFLHKHLKNDGVDVVTCACVGGSHYLIEQFTELGETSFPTILTPSVKHHFGKLYERDYRIWQALLAQTGVEFDLLYDPLMWQCLMEWLPTQQGRNLLYIHQGGIIGNESMLPRYRRKFG